MAYGGGDSVATVIEKFAEGRRGSCAPGLLAINGIHGLVYK